MDIKHKLGQDMIITLNSNDLNMMSSVGYCMDRNGLVGHETKTWVRCNVPTEQPVALIDGASDVYVHLPNGKQDLPVRIEQPDIDPYMDLDRGRIEFYFGTLGAIVVQSQT